MIGTADGRTGPAAGGEIITIADTTTIGDTMIVGAPGRLWAALLGPFALRCASMADSVLLCARPKERAKSVHRMYGRRLITMLAAAATAGTEAIRTAVVVVARVVGIAAAAATIKIMAIDEMTGDKFSSLIQR